MSIRTNILIRIYLSFGLVLLMALIIIVELLRIQIFEGNKWRSISDSANYRYVNVENLRGNILSAEGHVLAYTAMEYELRVDAMSPDPVVYNAKVGPLSKKLAEVFPDRSADYFRKLLDDARKQQSRYALIRRKVTPAQISRIRTFPLFKLGRYMGGMITVKKSIRRKPYRLLAARTIGYRNENNYNAVGIEGAYSQYMAGEAGKALVRKNSDGRWIPVNNEWDIPRKEGYDIISSISLNNQVQLESALLDQLTKHHAAYGSAVLMEVASGKVLAIANLTRTASGTYDEMANYAIAEIGKPGALFQPVSYLVAMDDDKIDTSTKISVLNGEWNLSGYNVKDNSISSTTLTAAQSFHNQSRVALARLIYQGYGNNPGTFTARIRDLQLDKKFRIQIPGEGLPLITNAEQPVDVVRQALGDNIKLTPLQLLSFYNGVANNGKLVSPLFVTGISHRGKLITQTETKTKTVKARMASPVAIKKLQTLLADNFPGISDVAGWADVTQVDSGYTSLKTYQYSFYGYFPITNPQYSLTVNINTDQPVILPPLTLTLPVISRIVAYQKSSKLTRSAGNAR